MNALTDAGLMDAVGVDAGQVIAELLKILPAHCVLSRKEDTRPYECDGLSLYRSGQCRWPSFCQRLRNRFRMY